MCDIPAAVVVVNNLCAVQDRARDYLAAAPAVPDKAAAAAECLALQHEVDGLVQIAAQPVMQQLLGERDLQQEVKTLRVYANRLGMAHRCLTAGVTIEVAPQAFNR
jgi:hypothetical protein